MLVGRQSAMFNLKQHAFPTALSRRQVSLNAHPFAYALQQRGGNAALDVGVGGASEPGLVTMKIGLAISLCCFNALCWSLPLRFRRLTSSERVLGVASTFSGGVFLTLAFVHMMPEAAGAFASGAIASADAMSLACCWTLAGYLLIWGVERAASSTTSSSDSHSSGGGTSAAILLGALSVHSILETMALAVARTKFAASLLAASIALHQPAESVALLVALVRAGLTGKKLVRLLLLFTAMGPIGSTLGFFLHGSFSATPLGPVLDGALLALTAGTFVFVGATEVIPEEFEGDKPYKKLKTISLAAGVSVMYFLTYIAGKLEAAI